MRRFRKRPNVSANKRLVFRHRQTITRLWARVMEGSGEAQVYFGYTRLQDSEDDENHFQRREPKPDYIPRRVLERLDDVLFRQGKSEFCGRTANGSRTVFRAFLNPQNPLGLVTFEFVILGQDNTCYYLTRSQIRRVLKVMCALEEFNDRTNRICYEPEEEDEPFPVAECVSSDLSVEEETETSKMEPVASD